MKKTTFNESTMVAFHIGRGGRFYNGGHLTFLGEGKIADFTEDCCAPSTILVDEDGNEELIVDMETPDAMWTDENGNGVGLTNEEYKDGIGRIDMDGEYDTTYTTYLKDVEEGSDEWDAIFASNHSDALDAQMFLCPQMGIETLEELADFINENEDWSNDVKAICENNCWEVENDEWHVCNDGENQVIFDDTCTARVTEYK